MLYGFILESFRNKSCTQQMGVKGTWTLLLSLAFDSTCKFKVKSKQSKCGLNLILEFLCHPPPRAPAGSEVRSSCRDGDQSGAQGRTRS